MTDDELQKEQAKARSDANAFGIGILGPDGKHVPLSQFRPTDYELTREWMLGAMRKKDVDGAIYPPAFSRWDYKFVIDPVRTIV
jgi:hypothetical protein